MELLINGKTRTVAPSQTVLAVLKQHGLNPAEVVVELNRAILDRSRFAETSFSDGDHVEILRFVGGG